MTVKSKSKTQAHTRYFLQDGTEVPGVTTILRVLNKPALIHWGWDLGMKGVDYRKYRDKMADIGTIAHMMILEHLSGEKQDYSEFSSDDIDKAENCLISFFEWEKSNRIEPILVEEPFTSEVYRYGGTIDCYCRLNGIYTLLDFKTSKAIYGEMIHQVSAYKNLLEESSFKVEQVRILRIGRSEDEGFEDKLCTRLDKHFRLFRSCLEIYYIQKELKRGV